jgi:anti-anti-sigma regulatory factor
MRQQFAQRLVIELDDVPRLETHLIGEIQRLARRIRSHGGLLRLCGATRQARDALRVSRLDSQFPPYPTRHDAVMGFRPAQPR